MSFPSTRIRCFAILGALLVLFSSGCTTYRAARLFQSGSAALDRGDLPVAVADLERAALLAPQASEIQNHLGIAYTESGSHAAALAAYQRAVELDCDNAAAQHNLRLAQESKLAGVGERPTPGELEPEGDAQ